MENIPIIRRYQRGDRHYVQAQRIWLILASFVSGPTRKDNDARTITYGEVAVLMGYDPRAGLTLHKALGIVGWYCLRNKLPALNSIVVNKSGEPGDEVVLTDGKTPAQERNAVFDVNWLEYGVPSTGTLRKVYAHYGT